MQLNAKTTRAQKFLRCTFLVFILMLGAVLRFATAYGTVVDHPVRNDGRDYIAYAWNLKSFGIYSKDFSTVNQPAALLPTPDAYRPPGYPLMLQSILHDRVDPRFWELTTHIQAWIAMLTLACSIWLAVELLGPWMGLITGMLVAISPHQSIYVPYFLTETLYGFLLVAAVGFAVMSLRSTSLQRRYLCASVAGLLFAGTCLVRPTLNQWIPVLLLTLLLPRVRRFHREILICAAFFFVAMSPWWIRNANSTHEISDARQMRITVQQGTYPDFMYKHDPSTLGYPYAHDPSADEATQSWAKVFADVRSKFSDEPFVMLRWYAVGKTAYFFHWSPPDGWLDMFTYPVWRSPWLTDPMFVLITAIMRALYVPLIACGLLGTILAFMPRTGLLFDASAVDGVRLVAFLHLFAIGIHVIGAPFARYSVPFRPLTFLLAMFFLLWIVRHLTVEKETSYAVAGRE